MAFRTCSSSLIGRWPSPSLSTYANLRLSNFSRSSVSSSVTTGLLLFSLRGPLHTLFPVLDRGYDGAPETLFSRRGPPGPGRRGRLPVARGPSVAPSLATRPEGSR